LTTEERLEKLEYELAAGKRRNRWLLVLLGLAVVGLGLVWKFTPATPTTQKVIRANSFVLQDEWGRERALLGVKDGPGLALYDERGVLRAILGVSELGSSLSLHDEYGQGRVVLAMVRPGPALGLYDWKAQRRAFLSLTVLGPDLSLYDEYDRVIWSAKR